MQFHLAKRVFQLAFIVNILVSVSPVWAKGHSSLIGRCLAFSAAPQAQLFFEKNLARWSEIEVDRMRAQTVVREVLSELVNHPEMGQQSKVEYWREAVRILRTELRIKFMSEEFQGTDGSILFQGATSGIALVVGPNGELYRGQLEVKLDRKQVPPPLWQADYTGFKWLNPPVEMLAVDSTP